MNHLYFWFNIAASMFLNYMDRKIEAAIFLAAASVIGTLSALHKQRHGGDEGLAK